MKGLTPWQQAYYHAGCAARHVSRALTALCGSREVVWMCVGWVMACIFAMLLSGCALFGHRPIAAIKGGDLAAAVSATAPHDTGKPANVQSDGQETKLALPAGSTVTVTRIDAQPATDKAPAVPAKEVREIHLAADSVVVERTQHVAATTGTIDTSVANHRIDVAERRWLLWAAIACGIGGIVVRQLVPLWPGISNGLLLGGALAFGAWKFADVPSWIFAVAIAVCVLIALGYKRGEWDANGNGIPDILERKS